MIYFITYENMPAYVKIGYAKDFEQRKKSYVTYNPTPVVVYKVMEGSMDEERALHDKFRAFRANNEWFYYAQAIQDYVAGEDVLVEEEAGCLPRYLHQKREGNTYTFIRTIPLELRKALGIEEKLWTVPLSKDLDRALEMLKKEVKRTDLWIEAKQRAVQQAWS